MQNKVLMKQSRYVGPDELRELISDKSCDTPIQRRQDIICWLKSNGLKKHAYDELVTTFIINTLGRLCLADRQKEDLVWRGFVGRRNDVFDDRV